MQKAIRKRKERKERKGKTVRERMKRRGRLEFGGVGGGDRRRRLVKRGTELLDAVV
jgi:hypothetical protein